MRKHRVLTTLTAGVAGLLCLLVQTSLAAPPVGNSSRPTGFATAAVRFDAATDQVTLTLPVQDRYGNYIPHAHPDNFVVYENGTPQKDITVQIKRSPLELGIVLEYGGRYPTLNEAISSAVSSAARNLLSDITEKDTVAVWTYGDRLVQISGFQKGPEGLQHALQSLITPPVSESNLYDAIAGALAQMRSRNDGRKALLVISSGVDTFSTTRYQDLLELAGTSGVPIYVIDVGAILKRDVSFSLSAAAG